MIPLVPSADSGWALAIPLVLCGAGLGLLVSQLNNYTLTPISDERAGEAAGVNSAVSSFGLSVGLAFAGAILLAALSISFTEKSDASTVLPADDKAQIAEVLEDDAQVMSDEQLAEQLARASRPTSPRRSCGSTRRRGRRRFRWRSPYRCWSACSASSSHSG